MGIKIGVLKEQSPHEHRVSIDPEVVKRLTKSGKKVFIENSAGSDANFFDVDYTAVGAEIVDRKTALTTTDIVVMIDMPDDETLAALKDGQVVIGLFNSLTIPAEIEMLAKKNVSVISMELLPRTISRAQTMDVLSSQSSVAGYKAALIASDLYPKYFPMMITAAGTVKPAKVLVLGTGVAGLQAIGTAKRLGAIVSGYDVRPASRGEVESLGATFLTSSVANGAGNGGYARQLTAEEQAAQQKELADFIAQNDIVITTAQVPGHKPPLLVTDDSVTNAKPGTIFVDLAASELGGNVAGSQPFKTITTEQHVTIVGAGNLASQVSNSASQLFAKNILAVLNYIIDEDTVQFDLTDDVLKDLVATHKGDIVNPRLRKALDLPDLPDPHTETEES